MPELEAMIRDWVIQIRDTSTKEIITADAVLQWCADVVEEEDPALLDVLAHPHGKKSVKAALRTMTDLVIPNSPQEDLWIIVRQPAGLVSRELPTEGRRR